LNDFLSDFGHFISGGQSSENLYKDTTDNTHD
jgi:hypothetical protein